jgi:solute carrier family 35 protein E3
MISLTAFLILGSIGVSTSLILINKQAMSVHGFTCPTFLTSYHFLLSFVLLELMGNMRFFTISGAIPALDAWKMAFFGVASIVAMNMNLKTNSIGFYQLSKLCTIPCLVAYKFFVLHERTAPLILMSLAILLAGLSLFTVNDVQFNVVGAIIALIAVITTATYQTLTGTLQKQFAVSGTQLNHRVSAPQFMIGFLSGSVLETHGTANILSQSFHFEQVLLVLASGLFAVLGNLIGFSLIGRAGPITFQVVGHVKTMLIFVFGLVMFAERSETREQLLKKIGGLVVSMVGVVLYTIFEMKARAANAVADRLAELKRAEAGEGRRDKEEGK